MKRATTIEDIEQLDREMLFAHDIAPILGCSPNSIRIQAQTDARKLGFPVIVNGTRVRIPKYSFLYFLKYGYPNS